MRDADRRAPQLAAESTARASVGRQHQEVHPDRHRAQGNGLNVEIAAPLVGDIESVVSALLDGMGGLDAAAADWTGAISAKAQRNVAKMAPQAHEQQRARWTFTARSAAAHDLQATPGCHPRQRRRQHARFRPLASSTCTSRANGSMSAPGASWASAWALPSPPQWKPASRCWRRGRQRLRLLRHGGRNHLPVQPAGLHRRSSTITASIAAPTSIPTGRDPGDHGVRQGSALRQDDGGVRRSRRHVPSPDDLNAPSTQPWTWQADPGQRRD